MSIRSIIRAGLAASMLGFAASAQAAKPKPFTVPEIRDWHGADGAFELPAGARVTY